MKSRRWLPRRKQSYAVWKAANVWWGYVESDWKNEKTNGATDWARASCWPCHDLIFVIPNWLSTSPGLTLPTRSRADYCRHELCGRPSQIRELRHDAIVALLETYLQVNSSHEFRDGVSHTDTHDATIPFVSSWQSVVPSPASFTRTLFQLEEELERKMWGFFRGWQLDPAQQPNANDTAAFHRKAFVQDARVGDSLKLWYWSGRRPWRVPNVHRGWFFAYFWAHVPHENRVECGNVKRASQPQTFPFATPFVSLSVASDRNQAPSMVRCANF